ncbi:MAG: hypothetical protein IJQ34_01360 [Kiritimatiellae bacterium]|nr:hypothetical protein [Kiritimatiellia bacterium]
MIERDTTALSLSPTYKAGRAVLSNDGKYSFFSYDGNVIKFMTSPRLDRYVKVNKWDNGYIEVIAQYGEKKVEEYIDLIPILKNLYINPQTFLNPIKEVEVTSA